VLEGFLSEITTIEKMDFGGEINPNIKPETDITIGKAKELYDSLFRPENLKIKDLKLREPTELEKLYIKEKINMSDRILESYRINLETGNVRIKCINENLAGKKHEITDVEYIEKVMDINGIKMEGVFPEFKSIKDVQLPENHWTASDHDQEKFCNEKLKDYLSDKPESKKEFTEKQLQMIENGHTPRGYTWHHAPEGGRMQLVKTEVHSNTPHTGGKAIWGGGQDFR
jgi:hypothetical protein